MCVGKNLSHGLGIAVFLLGLVSYADGQTITKSREGFETNDFSSFPWETSGEASWHTTRQERYSGSYCAESGSIEGNESTALQVTLRCASGSITFYRKVSSESGFDRLKFYIDGDEKDDWSGEEDWAEVSFAVTAGTRTFEWVYSKDGSISEGDDAAWVDDIVFPAEGDIEPPNIPFTRGVNLSMWFEAASVRHVNFTKFTKQDLVDIKNLGCDVIRLPIKLSNMTDGEPDYTIDPLFYSYLDQVVDWTEELGLQLIFDNHPINVPTDPSVIDILIPIWTQMARHYQDRSNLIYYEVLNEPHGLSDATWNGIQKEVIDAIRTVDQTHAIIVGATQWNSYNNLKHMPVYADDNLIYTFHFYDPMLFTHQGTYSTKWPSASLSGVPFPYDASRMPERPPDFIPGTWAWDRWENYPHEGTIEYVNGLIDIAADFQRTRNVQLLCGEFGVYMPKSYNEDRVRWYGVVRRHLEENGIAWTMWDYKGPFHIFEKGSPLMFKHDLNIPLIEALGLTVPPQQEFVLRPDTKGFDVYRDHEAPGIVITWWVAQGILDFFSEDNPASGYFCIHWAGIKQYHPLTFYFSPVKDLSVLVNKGFAIDFWIRCNDPDAKIDIRFVDTKTDDPDDHPWRMRYTLDRNSATWNNQWNHLHIPLTDFSEHGAWDNAWYNPIGAFDWAAVDRFEIVPEYGDLTGIHFYFDDIRVVEPN